MGAGDQGRLHGGGDLGAESRSTEELGRQRREKGRSGPRGQHEQGVGWGGGGGESRKTLEHGKIAILFL